MSVWVARQLAKLSCQKDRIAGKMKITETDGGGKETSEHPSLSSGMTLGRSGKPSIERLPRTPPTSSLCVCL